MGSSDLAGSDMTDLTPEEIEAVRKLLDEAEKMAWLAQMVRRWVGWVLAIVAGLVAFRNDIADLFWR